MTVKQYMCRGQGRASACRVFHGKLDGETTFGYNVCVDGEAVGFFIGLMVGEGSFGGDGRQPQVTLRMHTRHEAVFRWLEEAFPGSKLYGPYSHGGRDYFQWMARGAVLREQVVPLLASHGEWLDDYTAARFARMCADYGIHLVAPAPG